MKQNPISDRKDHTTENKRRTGAKYERFAADYLQKQGMVILKHNYRGGGGEIDIIGRDGKYLVFVEVKYRKNEMKGSPAEAVTVFKQQRIRRAARSYLYVYHDEEDIPCRFDVVSILDTKIQWIKDAF